MTQSNLLTARHCRAGDSTLIVADIQAQAGNAMPAKVLNRVVLNATLLIRSAALLGVPVLHSEHTPATNGATLPAVEDALPADALHFEKQSFSCCGADGFAGALDRSGRRQVVVVGIESHISVLQTALDLSSAGLELYVVEDAICSRRLENYQNALDRMRQSGITVVSAESVVFEWLGSSAHPEFAAVQNLLR